MLDTAFCSSSRILIFSSSIAAGYGAECADIFSIVVIFMTYTLRRPPAPNVNRDCCKLFKIGTPVFDGKNAIADACFSGEFLGLHNTNPNITNYVINK
jgi:hypothetical protein